MEVGALVFVCIMIIFIITLCCFKINFFVPFHCLNISLPFAVHSCANLDYYFFSNEHLYAACKIKVFLFCF